MRIISGLFKNHSFKSPAGRRTHPMSEKMRGAIFNMLGNIEDLTVLDAFAGSGALGFEAVSRGVTHVTLIDNDKKAYKAIVDNIESLRFEEQVKATRANVSSWSDNNRDMQFDIVMCDPPYNEIRPEVLDKLTRHVRPGGLMVLSLPPDYKPKLPQSFQLSAQKSYGDSTLRFFTRHI